MGLWHSLQAGLGLHLCTCVGFPRETPPPSSEAGQPLGASAGQTSWKRLPSLGRVNPGAPATLQPPGMGEGRPNRGWKLPQVQGTAMSRFPPPWGLPSSQLLLPNKKQTRELRGTSQKTEGRATEVPHCGPQILPHFLRPPIKGQSWVTSASYCPRFRTTIFILSSCLPPAGFYGKLKGPGFKNLCPA